MVYLSLGNCTRNTFKTGENISKMNGVRANKRNTRTYIALQNMIILSEYAKESFCHFGKDTQHFPHINQKMF